MGVLLAFVVMLAVEYLCIAGLWWLVCWALALLGITVAWSWLSSLAVFIIVEIIRLIF